MAVDKILIDSGRHLIFLLFKMRIALFHLGYESYRIERVVLSDLREVGDRLVVLLLLHEIHALNIKVSGTVDFFGGLLTAAGNEDEGKYGQKNEDFSHVGYYNRNGKFMLILV
ncbi:MAG: hypothetical protein A4E57_02836 [Syntrophorhabdaceae bacterium PtaU1.Bin034]|nr:MAG: hypothetical protein A4E57_02836 [Syntrophorhabdaceae bacterium PtaU1.Bin034]